MTYIDLNCDCGEGFGAYTLGDDTAMFEIVTSANIACGFHAGDPEIMAATFKRARDKNIAVGAHPGFADLAGFGRRPLPCSAGEAERLTAYQIGAAQAMAALAGHKITYVKPHGALSNLAMADAALARAIARAVRAVDKSLAMLAIAGTQLEFQAGAEGLRAVREIFADRAYDDAGLLVPRSQPGAVLHDPEAVAQRVVAMIREGAVVSTSGKWIPVGIESVCVHGDTPGAVEMAQAVRRHLEAADIALRAFSA